MNFDYNLVLRRVGSVQWCQIKTYMHTYAHIQTYVPVRHTLVGLRYVSLSVQPLHMLYSLSGVLSLSLLSPKLCLLILQTLLPLQD